MIRSIFCLLIAQISFAQSYTTTTFAGSPRLLDGHPAKSVPLRYPYGAAQDSSGNVYFADSDDNRIRKVDPQGIISTIAGTGEAGFGGDGDQATKAKLKSPQGIKLDGKGNLYIADYNNNRVRKLVLATGVITTVAGNGNFHYSGDGGKATDAGLDPYDIAVDSSGNLYIADYYNNRIRKVSALDETISTIAGTSIPGDGDNGPANQAPLNGPRGISVDTNGVIYFVDEGNNRVKRIDQAQNKITTAIGSGAFGYGVPSIDGDGRLATKALLLLPFSTAVESNNNVLLTCATEVWRLTISDGNLHFIAGSDSLGFSGDGGLPTNAKFNVPLYVGSAPNGDVLVTDLGNQRIRRIHQGVLDTVAGTSILDNIPATSAFLNLPDGLLIDSKGNLLVADTGASRVRSILPSGNIAAYQGSGIRGSAAGQFFFPSGMAMDAQGTVYIADSSNDRVMKVPLGGSPAVVAGGSSRGYGGDGGFAPRALLNHPVGVAVDSAGNVYIADRDNFMIRMVDSNQNISRFAGTGSPLFSGDNDVARNAGMSVADLAISGGFLYFTDPVNNRVRKIDLGTKIITTVAGVGTAGLAGDGGPPTSAQLNLPLGLAFDASGNLFIADNGNSVVRMISGGKISTIAGTGKAQFNVETGTALAVAIDPTRILVDKDGSIYITDQHNDRVRKLVPQIASAMSIVSGNNTSGIPGRTLSLSVKVVDSLGNPVGNAAVTFAVTSGSATPASSTVNTDANGIATASVTLGQTIGPVVVTASAAKVTPLTFNLNVTAPPVQNPAPTINLVQGSGFSTPGIVALSTGGIATVKGKGFGAPANFVSVGVSDLVNGLVPTKFLGICVMISGVRAPIFGASDTQVNFQSPVMSGTSVTVSVISGCDGSTPAESNKMTIAVQTATPEFFYAVNRDDGHNPVIATDSISGALLVASDLFPGAGLSPARSGQYVTIYGTGFGPTSPSVAPGEFGSTLAGVTADYKVTLGGRDLPAANVGYVGVTPGSPGLYQVNVVLPDDTPDGDLSFVLTVGGISSSPGAYLTVRRTN